jgi:hypothetical protein
MIIRLLARTPYTIVIANEISVAEAIQTTSISDIASALTRERKNKCSDHPFSPFNISPESG